MGMQHRYFVALQNIMSGHLGLSFTSVLNSSFALNEPWKVTGNASSSWVSAHQVGDMD